MICLTRERIRTNECFDEFLEKVLQIARKHDIKGRFLLGMNEVGSDDGHFHDFPEMLSQQNYLKFLILW